MKVPYLGKGNYSVLAEELNTGIVLTIEGVRYLGEGETYRRFETLEVILETNKKKRFSFNEDESLIRANQGHSIEIDLGYIPKIPPKRLFHGTGAKYVDSIYKTGIKKKNRHHVHLSKEIETALSVG